MQAFDSRFSIVPESSPGALGCANDLPVEFYRLQTAYFEAQLALSHEAQHLAECQAQPMADYQAQGLPPPLNYNEVLKTELPFGEATLPEGDFSKPPLPLRPDELQKRRARPRAQAAQQPALVRDDTIMDPQGAVVEKNSNASKGSSSEGHSRKRGSDSVPLYEPGGPHAEAAVLELRDMENDFRADTSRRISQVAISQGK